MAMKVPGALSHPVPGLERVMAHDEPCALDFLLGIARDSLPTAVRNGAIAIVVADDQSLTAMETLQQFPDSFGLQAIAEVTEMPDEVIRSHHRVPILYERGVHFCDRPKGSLEQAERTSVTEVRVGGEPCLQRGSLSSSSRGATISVPYRSARGCVAA